MNLYNSLLLKISKHNAITLIISFLLLEISTSFIFGNLFSQGAYNVFKFDSILEEIVAVVFFGPLIETYLVQYLIITTILKYSKQNTLLALFISALVFGLSHYYSVPYIIKTFFAGLTFGTLFLSQRPNFNKAFIYVLITHASYNLFASIMNNI